MTPKSPESAAEPPADADLLDHLLRLMAYDDDLVVPECALCVELERRLGAYSRRQEAASG